MPKAPSSEVSSSKGVYRRAAWRPLDGEAGEYLAAQAAGGQAPRRPEGWDASHVYINPEARIEII